MRLPERKPRLCGHGALFFLLREEAVSGDCSFPLKALELGVVV
ncbi:hypothetical protein GEOBRER4_n1298 [Citrifermentans bremense]|uniref:Uncharacterized protein n=1 Tax=Citrifermentans bremense TaxID=60035 RepID=A0A7R7FSK8_9BACT|nr:hypothetical protein GEOBRER4_n1298 [Citrifermentans bremense]